MAIHLAFDYSGIIQRNLRAEESSDEDDGSDAEESLDRKKRERYISHNNFSKKRSHNNVEVAGILICVFFVAATTVYAVYYKEFNSLQDDNSKVSFSPHFAEDAPSDNLYNEPRLPKLFTPLKYTLYIYPNITEMYYTGLVKIRVQCNTKTSQIVLHSTEHDITEIAIKTINVTDIEDILVNRTQRNLKRKTLILSLNQILVKDYLYDFYIGFKGNLTNSISNGMYVSSTKDNNGIPV